MFVNVNYWRGTAAFGEKNSGAYINSKRIYKNN